MSEPDPIPEDEIPPELRNAFPVAPEPNHVVPKRSAKAVAEELTGRPCVVKDKDGCWITVKYEAGEKSFRGATWWLALRELNHYLTTIGKGPKSQEAEPLNSNP